VDAARTEAILKAQGWAVAPDGADCWRGTVRSEGASFPTRVRLGADRLEVIVGPLMAAPAGPPDAHRVAALHARALAANATVRMARFALETDGSVVLCVDYPRAHLDDSEVRDALDAASYYAGRWFAQLAEIA